ncbi:aminopeptidase [Salpingoeca rosetta]|uniref:Aminopeptidase n=1 Tax=Salpingoeca rosetta (strain ATCC 50818 / BSB-021) TaxID=946362 RepID=F2U729_SALR5|nr:aminopeptidase [Salpingoeca rosetta]EGD83661.1 aminopeptidase [Salpingoeca rosetta]|eukprot:XP_004995165.1 aminopeptidase [Salpingoeca rosetta]
MPVKLVFASTLATRASRVVFVGRQAELVKAVQGPSSPILAKLAGSVQDTGAAAAVCASALEAIKGSESPINGASTSVTVPAAAGGDGEDKGLPYVRLCFVMTPSAATRFNSVVRPDAITRSVRSFMGGEFGHEGETLQVVYVVPLEAHTSASQDAMCVTAASAVSRAVPTYSRKGNKMETSSRVTAHVAFMTPDGNMHGEGVLYDQIAAISEGVRRCAALVDTPCNELHSASFAKAALDLAESLPGVTGEEIVGEELREQGLGGIYGVGKASVNPPRLVILKYTPEGATKTIAWCGKGIVYDTGGLSIKGKTTMPGMKRDMGGAAGVLNAFVAAVKCGFKDNLYCLLAIAENSVGPAATRPDDIHVLYSGKTVEINNTDAEGRLVLGDAVAYAAQHFNPDVLVNMCTLTGAQGVATGKRHAAIVCSDERLEGEAVAAGRASGDLVHPLMWCPELFSDEFKSAVADMKNSVANRSNAQVSCAAQFIGNHLPEGFTDDHAWLHIDMAAPAYSGERATGFGVALLCQLFVLRA